jgi:hypothetical protein
MSLWDELKSKNKVCKKEENKTKQQNNGARRFNLMFEIGVSKALVIPALLIDKEVAERVSDATLFDGLYILTITELPRKLP